LSKQGQPSEKTNQLHDCNSALRLTWFHVELITRVSRRVPFQVAIENALVFSPSALVEVSAGTFSRGPFDDRLSILINFEARVREISSRWLRDSRIWKFFSEWTTSDQERHR
jgi:hypothetical protein